MVKLPMPPELVKPFEELYKAEGVTPRAIVERAVIAFIQAGCPTLIPRLSRKEEVDLNSTVRERRIQSAVRRALGENRGHPRRKPLPLEDQAEVERRVEAWHKANPRPIYETLYEDIPKASEEVDPFDDFSEIADTKTKK